MENDEMTNDAAVAYRFQDRLADGTWQDQYWHRLPPWEHRNPEPLYSATTVAELRAQITAYREADESMQEELARQVSLRMAAERRVAELGALLDETRYWVGDDSEFPAELRLRIEAALTKESP